MRSDPSRGVLRSLRTLTAAGLVVGLGGAAHGLGGGAGPTPLTLAVLLALLAPLGWVVTARRLTAPRLLAVLGLGQGAVHGILTLMAPASTGSAGAGPPGARSAGLLLATHHPSPLRGLVGVLDADASSSALDTVLAHAPHGVDGALSPALGHAGTHSSAAMLLAHVLATLLAAVLLARGEAVLWRVFARLAPVIPTPGHLEVVRVATWTAYAVRRGRTPSGPGRPRGPPRAVRSLAFG